jgi:outer membrane protein
MTLRSKPRTPAAALVALCAALAPAAGHAQTLEEALTAAYASNPQLAAERALLRATDEDVPQALANWRPTVSLAASQSYNHEDIGGLTSSGISGIAGGGLVPTSSGIEVTRPYALSLTVTQPIYRGGRTEAQTAQALNQVRAERANLIAIEQTVFLAVVTDYMNVVEEQATVDLDVNNEQVLHRQLESTNDRFSVGEVTRTDVAQAEASYASAIATRQAAEGQLQVYRASFERDVGQPAGKLLAPKSVPELPTSRDEAVAIAAEANPNVISSQYAEQAAEDNIRLVRGQLLPTLSVQGMIERATDQQEAGDHATIAQVTANLTMPLYEGGAVWSQSRAAQETVAQRKHQLDDTRRGAVQSAATSWEQVQSVKATIKSLEEQIRANAIALEGVQQEASVGSRTVLDVLNAEQTLFQSRVTLVQSQHDEVVDEFGLAQALGRLTAKNLGLPVDYYDPDKNFEYVRNKWAGFGTGQ